VYLRIVYAKPEKRTRRRIGILRGMESLCKKSKEAGEILDWLNIHLPLPPKSAFSSERALCWFKLDARACIEQVRDLAFQLERRGERVCQVYSRNPGLITYEDDYQVVALPDALRFTDV
jgi:hypothetical protein